MEDVIHFIIKESLIENVKFIPYQAAIYSGSKTFLAHKLTVQNCEQYYHDDYNQTLRDLFAQEDLFDYNEINVLDIDEKDIKE